MIDITVEWRYVSNNPQSALQGVLVSLGEGTGTYADPENFVIWGPTLTTFFFVLLLLFFLSMRV